jgi:uncharacterized membrane protein
MKPDNAATEKMLALTLKIGAYSAFAFIVAGLATRYFRPWGDSILATGFLILLATPGLRIIVAGIQFLRGHEYKYVLVSLGVLAVIVLAFVLGVQA